MSTDHVYGQSDTVPSFDAEPDTGTVPAFGETAPAEQPSPAAGTAEESAPESGATEPKQKKTSKPKRSSAASPQVRKRIARQVLDDVARLREAEPETRSLAANLLGCDDDPDEMAIELAAGAAGNTKIVTVLTEVKDLDNGIERVSKLGELNYSTEFAEAWSLMHELGLVGRKRPNNQIKAVTDLAEAVDGVDERLTEAVALLQG